MCKIDVDIVVPNFAALHAAVFSLFAKNLRGGGADNRRPPAVRGLRENPEYERPAVGTLFKS